MKKLNKDIFIEKSIVVHNNKYNYDVVEYKNVRTKIKIICPVHGIFEQLPWVHMKGNGCSNCQNLSKVDFVKKSIEIHGEKYNYDLSDLINNKTKVKIICYIHGIFEQTPNNHLSGSGCSKCFNERKKSNTFEFINKSKLIHNDLYNYESVKYLNNKTKVDIICKEHGVFKQTPIHHLNGHGCPKCVRIINTDNFIDKSIMAHGDLFDYSMTAYSGHGNKVDIICKKHGKFSQSPMSHLRGIGCPKCSSSKGEKIILNFLTSQKIEYVHQKKFKNCKNKNNLLFDFYLPNYNICIEYNGIQHYKEVEHFGGLESLNMTVNNDNIKKDFCKNNNIKLLIISYEDDIICYLKNNIF